MRVDEEHRREKRRKPQMKARNGKTDGRRSKERVEEKKEHEGSARNGKVDDTTTNAKDRYEIKEVLITEISMEFNEYLNGSIIIGTWTRCGR